MSRSYEIFATRDDLINLFSSIEKAMDLQYVQTGLFPYDEPIVCRSICDIENFGIASTGDQNLELTFLILERNRRINVRTVPQRRGGLKYAVDQLENPESVAFTPGGDFEGRVLISGRIGTANKNEKSLYLLRLIGEEIRREFEKIRAFFVGRQAVSALDSGVRLTASIAAPTRTDLRRNG